MTGHIEFTADKPIESSIRDSILASYQKAYNEMSDKNSEKAEDLLLKIVDHIFQKEEKNFNKEQAKKIKVQDIAELDPKIKEKILDIEELKNWGKESTEKRNVSAINFSKYSKYIIEKVIGKEVSQVLALIEKKSVEKETTQNKANADTPLKGKVVKTEESTIKVGLSILSQSASSSLPSSISKLQIVVDEPEREVKKAASNPSKEPSSLPPPIPPRKEDTPKNTIKENNLLIPRQPLHSPRSFSSSSPKASSTVEPKGSPRSSRSPRSFSITTPSGARKLRPLPSRDQEKVAKLASRKSISILSPSSFKQKKDELGRRSFVITKFSSKEKEQTSEVNRDVKVDKDYLDKKAKWIKQCQISLENLKFIDSRAKAEKLAQSVNVQDLVEKSYFLNIKPITLVREITKLLMNKLKVAGYNPDPIKLQKKAAEILSYALEKGKTAEKDEDQVHYEKWLIVCAKRWGKDPQSAIVQMADMIGKLPEVTGTTSIDIFIELQKYVKDILDKNFYSAPDEINTIEASKVLNVLFERLDSKRKDQLKTVMLLNRVFIAGDLQEWNKVLNSLSNLQDEELLIILNKAKERFVNNINSLNDKIRPIEAEKANFIANRKKGEKYESQQLNKLIKERNIWEKRLKAADEQIKQIQLAKNNKNIKKIDISLFQDTLCQADFVSTNILAILLVQITDNLNKKEVDLRKKHNSFELNNLLQDDKNRQLEYSNLFEKAQIREAIPYIKIETDDRIEFSKLETILIDSFDSIKLLKESIKLEKEDLIRDKEFSQMVDTGLHIASRGFKTLEKLKPVRTTESESFKEKEAFIDFKLAFVEYILANLEAQMITAFALIIEKEEFVKSEYEKNKKTMDSIVSGSKYDLEKIENELNKLNIELRDLDEKSITGQSREIVSQKITVKQEELNKAKKLRQDLIPEVRKKKIELTRLNNLLSFIKTGNAPHINDLKNKIEKRISENKIKLNEIRKSKTSMERIASLKRISQLKASLEQPSVELQKLYKELSLDETTDIDEEIDKTIEILSYGSAEEVEAEIREDERDLELISPFKNGDLGKFQALFQNRLISAIKS